MVREVVGAIASLWRYPVKSMLGEEIEVSKVTTRGLAGDRAYALLDTQSGKVASAKNPKKWAKLLDFQASLTAMPQGYESLPPVKVSLPNGDSITSEAPEVSKVLSAALGREVELLSCPPETPTLEQYWPSVEGTAHQDAVTQLLMPTGTFFDSCSIHAMTTATLARLHELYPEGQFERCRFRPNFVIEPTSREIAFLEDEWVGGILAIGETVRLSIDTACPRCVVTTLAQSGLPEDLNILRTTARYNNVIAGIRMSVLQGGTIRRNDSVWLEKAT
ncbi:MOSC N-terminal beta barrel domain-containing protein [Oculatella sp. FACHB-28]|uniref:MOSC domain-containing protein n=1 Tax=Oculatella sp. FACHB-28 TaxID=2692845 RepID=UPI0016846093|nr:MOSC N-terminal beta barrel domain-containing protein [Oculatella sp. FACHB-28]MBD2057159.1 MOSC N-terminal beta barrel domain-containing protein [Oculatella sp. FACHB-28]